MLRQIKHLAGVQLCNLFGLNEMRHSKDAKKKRNTIWMGIAWLFVFVVIIGYLVLLSMGLASMGMAQVIPVYLFTITSMVILIFTFLKAGSILFQMESFEMMMSLPVSRAAIVVSRFLTMYVTNLMMSLLVMLPGTIVYGIFSRPPFWFYIYSLIGTILLPLGPISIATLIGAGVTALTSRMKNKSLLGALFTVALVFGIMMLNMNLTSQADTITDAMFRDFATGLTDQLSRLYPPAAWYAQGVVHGNIGAFALYAFGSLAVFAAMIAILQRYFLQVCTALNARRTKNNYRMQSLKQSSPVMALCKKEFKRYFASGIYVTNTAIGLLMMVILSIALLAAGVETVETSLGMPGVVQNGLPFVLSFLAAMMPITSCSISMEGKSWWVAQTLPLRSKDIFDAKILTNLLLASPFYLISVVCSSIAVRAGLLGTLWIVVIPAVYIVFSAVVGISINLALPMMQWDNEVRVVKQSASTLVSMLTGMGSILLPALALLLIKDISVDLVMGVTVVVLALTTVLLYRKNGKRGLIF